MVFGIQGSGKSYHCTRYCESNSSASYLGTGQLIRNNPILRQKVMNGNYLSDEEIYPIVIAEINQFCANSLKRILLLDGFPRSIAQYSFLLREFGLDRCLKILPLILYLDENSATSRVLQRGREDDKLEVLKLRYQLYRQNVMPMIQMLTFNHFIKPINTAEEKDLVHKKFSQEINKHLEQKQENLITNS
ncbi:AAA family ATPase [Candidatus Gracilibacteria bacterium]|nr:AAA family ATPase [Candidatus Gracilibacteria bacterium]